MSELESIVPALELCKLIPEGCFEASALIWYYDGAEWWVNAPEFDATTERQFPAPTLAEILEAIHKLDLWVGRGIATGTVFFGDDIDTFCLIRTDIPRATEDALKLWLKLKGIKI